MSELAWLPWTEAARRIRDGELSSVTYTEALLARVHLLHSTLHAFVSVREEPALDEARAADAAVEEKATLGPMHGVPFALKDIIDIAGMNTTAQSAILADNLATEDAAVTARLRRAGGIALGKLTTHEFASGGPCFDLPWPPARNPWDPRMFTGGSSSGSGAAVAAGLVPAALGTDTAGSVRNPASQCGIVGLKPTYGRVSRRGVVPLAYSLDHVGPMTRTVAENAALLGIIAGHDERDPASAAVPSADWAAAVEQGAAGDLRGVRIGVIRQFHREDMVASPVVDAGIEAAVAVMANLGAEVSEVRTLPLSDFAAGNRVILLAEAAAIHEQWLRSRPGDYSRLTREKLAPGLFLRAVDHVQALRNRPLFTAAIDEALAGLDVLLCASSMDPTVPVDDEQANKRFYLRQARAPFNLTGHPAMSVPAGFTDDDPALPLSFQLVAGHFDEAAIYRVAGAYEAATRWWDRRPPGPVGD